MLTSGPDTPDATGTAGQLPPVCSIKSLVAFGPGLHHEELYSPQRCDQIADNFNALGGRPVPLAKIGHDRQQQFARSLGFPNVGVVTRCQKLHGGCFEVDIDNVPTEVGGKVSAGMLRGASVELKNRQRDPRDPAREIPGDVMTGISLLGNEQPCVQNWPEDLRARAVPKATFADGSPVPPDYRMERWLNMASDVTERIVTAQGGQFSADRRTVRIRGREYAADTLCFSDFDPNPPGPTMDPKIQQLVALGLSQEQAQQALQICGTTTAAAAPPVSTATPAAGAAPAAATMAVGDGSANQQGQKGAMEFYDAWNRPSRNHSEFAAACKKFADDPATTPDQKAFASMFAQFSGELEESKKRIGELQASADAGAKKDEEAKMAAFSAQVEAECKKIERKFTPDHIEKVIRPEALRILTAKTFAAETDRVKTFSDFFAGLQLHPDDTRLATKPGPAKPLTAPERAAGNPILAAMVAKGGAIDALNPKLAEKYRTAAVA